MQQRDFEEVVHLIRKEDPRFAVKAYFFLRHALTATLKMQAEEKGQAPSHIRGQQLLEGIRLFALEQYGPLAKAVFNEWGIHASSDFGHIVFNLVEFGLLGKTQEDSQEDFNEGFDFDEAFIKPFRPQRKKKTSQRSRILA